MSLAPSVLEVVDLARPNLLALALIIARLAPASWLIPVLGGPAAPNTVRLALCLALATHAHFAGGIGAPQLADADALTVGAALARELFCGTVLGFIATLPFDAARMGGRFLDTFRGANAEASLPGVGSREAASGDLLYQLLAALVLAGPVFGLVASGLLLSFRVAPLGLPAPVATTEITELALRQATGALAAGLAIGAPIAAVSLLVDFGLGIAARIAPALPLREVASPARLLLGAAAILFGLGTISRRLLAEVAQSAEAARAAAELLGGGT